MVDRWTLVPTKQTKQTVRYDVFRDGKAVLAVWSSTGKPPKWVVRWLAELNHSHRMGQIMIGEQPPRRKK
jgi:hypothetical protein